jgi:hypothetical protein
VSFIGSSSGVVLFSFAFPLYSALKRTVHLTNDLRLNYILDDFYDLDVKFEFTAAFDKSVRSVTRKLKVYSERTHSIALFAPHAYQPGFRYVVQATVKDPLGKLVTKSVDNVKLYATYYNSRGTIVHKETLSRVIRDSLAEFVLTTTTDVTKIVYEVSFLKAREQQTVTNQAVKTPTLRVYIDNE